MTQLVRNEARWSLTLLLFIFRKTDSDRSSGMINGCHKIEALEELAVVNTRENDFLREVP